MSYLYEKIIRPAMFRLDAEAAHEFGIESLRVGLSSELAQRMALRRYGSPEFQHLEKFGLKFSNPLGVAAGFDKNGVAVNQLASLGFGFVEVGTVTFRPQKGNEKPRLFRLPDDKALINRLGFNNDGAEVVTARLKKLRRRCIVGVNIGRNKDVPNDEAVENYLASFDLVHEVADYIAINISSPNTPNLRELQQSENLEELLKAIQDRNRVLSSRAVSHGFSRPLTEEEPPKGGTQTSEPPEGRTRGIKPVLVKIAPDLNKKEIESIVDTCLRHDVSGIIATNTTISRENLKTTGIERLGAGGLSGRPITHRSNEVISSIFRYSKGKLPVMGVGGIFTADDAFAKIAAGASLVQAYTGFVYSGPAFARTVNEGLLSILRTKGFPDLNGAVGSSVRP
jgi:dihydroorotate dehydrogenase